MTKVPTFIVEACEGALTELFVCNRSSEGALTELVTGFQ